MEKLYEAHELGNNFSVCSYLLLCIMITLREAKKEDAPQLLRLIRELAEYEHASDEVTNTAILLAEDGWGKDGPQFFCFVAEENGYILGMALFHNAYSTWKGRYIYLDDLFVEEKSRGKGLGKLLFERLIIYCKKKGANQLRWHVLNWNEPALRFYKKYQASLDPEWITGKLHPPHFGIIDLKNKV